MEKPRSSMKKSSTTKTDDKRVKFAVPVTSKTATPPPPSQNTAKRAADVQIQSKPQKISKTEDETDDSLELFLEQNEVGNNMSDTEAMILERANDVRDFGITLITGIENVSNISSKLKHFDEFLMESSDFIKHIKDSAKGFDEFSKKETNFINKTIEAKTKCNNIAKELENYLETVEVPEVNDSSEDYLNYEIDFQKVCKLFNEFVNFTESL